MLDVKVIGSGSSGNCYLLTDNNGNQLILECGLSYKTIAEKIRYNFSRVQGVLITHEHKDHAKSCEAMLEHGLDVYTSEGTAKALNIDHHHRYHKMYPETDINIKTAWRILPLVAIHDAAEPFMFLIFNKFTNDRLLFATDTAYIVKRFSGLTQILIECNYSLNEINENVSDGIVDASRKLRTMKTHMSLETCKQFFLANKKLNQKTLKEIWLIHISRDNGLEEKFVKDIQGIMGVPVKTA